MAAAAGAASGARIATRQNDAWNIALLAAQRHTYTDLKLWRRFRVWLTVSVTVAGLLAVAMAGVVAPEWLKPVGLLAAAAYYHEFVQLERLKKNTQFGAKRTGFSVMANGRDGARDVV